VLLLDEDQEVVAAEAGSIFGGAEKGKGRSLEVECLPLEGDDGNEG